jgi:hypothetical protein
MEFSLKNRNIPILAINIIHITKSLWNTNVRMQRRSWGLIQYIVVVGLSQKVMI